MIVDLRSLRNIVSERAMIVDFRSAYERYAQDVYRFALYLCGDPALAEDIAAEEVLSQDYEAWCMICGWARLRKWQ